MATRFLNNQYLIVLCLGFALVVWGVLPATAQAMPEPDDSNRPLTRSELETLLESYPNISVTTGYNGPLPTLAEAQTIFSRAIQINSMLDTMALVNGDSGDGESDANSVQAYEVKRTCTENINVLGRVRFEFWLESNGSQFTDINNFETTFIPAPTLPTIGGVDLESIEGSIISDYNYPFQNGKKWAGGATVEIIYVILEWVEVSGEWVAQCSVSH